MREDATKRRRLETSNSIKFYTEFLPNLHYIIVHIELPESSALRYTVAARSDQVELFTNKGRFTIPLPLNTFCLSDVDINIPELLSKATLRLINAVHEAKSGQTDHLAFFSSSQLNTWPSILLCANCPAPLVHVDANRKWKDRPSETWNDLLDLWLCHRPHITSGTDANPILPTSFDASEGAPLVSIMYFTFHLRELINIEVSLSRFYFFFSSWIQRGNDDAYNDLHPHADTRILNHMYTK